MLNFLAACAWLAAADPVPPVPAHVYSSDTLVALVAGEKLSEVSYVAAHCTALQRYLEFALNLPPVPPPMARLEVADIPGLTPVAMRVAGGTVLVVVRLGDGKDAPSRSAEAAAQAWLARVAMAGGKSASAPEPWTRQALACEVIAHLRPAMNDFWYSEGRQAIPSSLADVIAGKAPEREAFLFWRALRQTLGAPAEQARARRQASSERESILPRAAAAAAGAGADKATPLSHALSLVGIGLE